jgi:hypothetical protein
MGGKQRDVDHGKEAASVPAVANQVRKRIPFVSAIHADVVAAQRDDLQLADVKRYTGHQRPNHKTHLAMTAARPSRSAPE